MTELVSIVRNVGGLIFDATFSEQHKVELEVTDNPVERGAPVTDHARMKPVSVTIKAGVSDTPLAVIDNDQFASDSGRTRRCYQILFDLLKAAEPITIQTGLASYINMLCVSIDTEQDSATSSALLFTATFREVNIVSTEKVKYPTRKKGTTKQQGDKKKNRGEQQGTDISSKTSDSPEKGKAAEKTKSALFKLVGG